MNSVLSRSTLDRMHAAAVAMLGRTGMMIEHAEVSAAVSRRSGFRLAPDGRVRIAPDRVDSWMRTPRPPLPGAPTPAEAPHGFICGTSERPSWIVEPDGRTLRPMTRADVIEGTKLIDVLHARGVRGRTPGVPMDVPAALWPIEQFLLGVEYSREGGGTSWVCDLGSASVIRDMLRACGRDFGWAVRSPSGLVLGGPELDILWHFRNEVRSLSVGTLPIMGLTAPCDFVGALTVAMAECLGGAAILHELLPEIPITLGPSAEPADLRTGVMVFGSPEWELLDLMQTDVYHYYGQGRAKLLLTSSSVPDAQAFAEHAVSAANGMRLGYRRFRPAGQLGLDEVYSPAMLLLDLDILAQAARTNIDLSLVPDPAQWVDVVDEVVSGGILFAEHETTIDSMRSTYRDPQLFRRMNRAQWVAAGCPDLVREAQAEAHRLAGDHNFEPPVKLLEELYRIRDRAVSASGGVGL